MQIFGSVPLFAETPGGGSAPGEIAGGRRHPWSQTQRRSGGLHAMEWPPHSLFTCSSHTLPTCHLPPLERHLARVEAFPSPAPSMDHFSILVPDSKGTCKNCAWMLHQDLYFSRSPCACDLFLYVTKSMDEFFSLFHSSMPSGCFRISLAQVFTASMPLCSSIHIVFFPWSSSKCFFSFRNKRARCSSAYALFWQTKQSCSIQHSHICI